MLWLKFRWMLSPINDTPALISSMVWCRIGNKAIICTNVGLVFWLMYASPGLEVLHKVHFGYSAVIFLWRLHGTHLIARLWGRDMECLLWMQSLEEIESVQLLFRVYCVIAHRNISRVYSTQCYLGSRRILKLSIAKQCYENKLCYTLYKHCVHGRYVLRHIVNWYDHEVI